MKKRELILDFTSLLDVMLILLFIVIANMNQVSLAAGDELNAKLAQADTQIQQLSGEREQLLAELNAQQVNREEYEAAMAELQQLQQRYETLQDEYDHLKITTNYDEDDLSVYQAAIEKITHVVLMCDTSQNPDTGNAEVNVNIYLDGEKDGRQSHVGSVRIVHDLSLSAAERERLIADQVVDMTKALSGAMRDDSGKMAWFSIQYHYDDKNFANSDLEIIYKALDNLEHSFGISCYGEEMKIY